MFADPSRDSAWYHRTEPCLDIRRRLVLSLQLILARCPSLTSSKNRLRDKTYCHPSHATADWTFLVDQQLASIATCSSLFANLSATQ
ncbi:uncharacterized protein LMH87_008876 [Akanthomyces muscarius]|uniref:Uncharacterized protein n=1 Tax=Akanthomyces muscarius TaxID=2231603 RepID=A0A9W8UME4_AKAMU|nr:uncharacterized protein LMH87_008876 [Akanthomyces muscarius]KAJ4158345.1 hypothetical protein LMH87_008876 [Akanthomyces muscarius]